LAPVLLFKRFLMNIYVGNLPYQLTEDELKETFEEFGEVESAKIIMDKYSGRSKGFGFVEMPNDAEAKKAIESMNDVDVKGRNIRVNQARERNDNFRNNDRY
jgi:RNA recognition motif-containing protein